MAEMQTQKQKTEKSQKSKSKPVLIDRPAIIPGRTYTRREATLACGVSTASLIRAWEAGFLKSYRVGRRVLHSGQQLLEWLEAGGKTGRALAGGVQ